MNKYSEGVLWRVCILLFLGVIPVLVWGVAPGHIKQQNSPSYKIQSIGGRKVYTALPKRRMPAAGFPVIILLHGREQTAGVWFGEGSLASGGQRYFTSQALACGFAILAPEAGEPFREGDREWDFLLLPDLRSKDLPFFRTLLDGVKKNRFAKFDADRIYIVGLSSGGVMASALAQTFGQRIRAIAIISAGRATNPSSSELPPGIPPTHPPTLIIYGAKDRRIPLAAAQQYYKELKSAGIKTEILIGPESHHQWLAKFDKKILEWFGATKKPSTQREIAMKQLTFDKSDNGKTVSLKSGDQFYLKLKGVPTAGYNWSIIEQDKTTVKMIKREIKSLAGPKMVGGAAIYTWQFDTLAPGDTQLVLKNYRPWEGPEKAVETFTLHIKIEQ